MQEAERRARVEGEMRINEERMRLEMQHKKKHSPVKAVLTVAGVLVLDRRRRRLQDVLAAPGRAGVGTGREARIEAQARKDRAELEAKLVGIEKNMNDQLAKAKTEEERQRIRIAAAEAKAAAQGSRQAPRHTTTKTEDKPVQLPKSKGKREISDNPLEGLRIVNVTAEPVRDRHCTNVPARETSVLEAPSTLFRRSDFL